MAEEKKRGTVARLLDFAGDRRGLTYVGCMLSAASMVLSMVPYVCIWLAIRDLVAVAPNWAEAASVAGYGWAAFGFAMGGILVYFGALMCTHLAAFRTATNIRKRCMEHLSKAPLGYFDTHASGLLRRRIDGAASQTETLLAHNLADVTGTAAMFVALLVLLSVFDWRMGAACLLAVLISFGTLFMMMG
ncbi:MAG TPA: ABC transporter transmembrane domain-containing protein, partial [Atopobiaceae bacterium]|nr:ABC transporter transmembrane domain-containing protein [Atopobiaceae bacterium]